MASTMAEIHAKGTCAALMERGKEAEAGFTAMHNKLQQRSTTFLSEVYTQH
jgi:hypothetical protein